MVTTNAGATEQRLAAIEELFQEYTRRYVARDIDGVVDLCIAPFVAVRDGRPIHLPDRAAVRDHFATVIDRYRDAGFAAFAPVSVDTRLLGDHAAFATVRWHAFDAHGGVARDSETTYHLLLADDGWRFLSYTNHF